MNETAAIHRLRQFRRFRNILLLLTGLLYVGFLVGLTFFYNAGEEVGPFNAYAVGSIIFFLLWAVFCLGFNAFEARKRP